MPYPMISFCVPERGGRANTFTNTCPAFRQIGEGQIFSCCCFLIAFYSKYVTVAYLGWHIVVLLPLKHYISQFFITSWFLWHPFLTDSNLWAHLTPPKKMLLLFSMVSKIFLIRILPASPFFSLVTSSYTNHWPCLGQLEHIIHHCNGFLSAWNALPPFLFLGTSL